jgi:hypothetical protein
MPSCGRYEIRVLAWAVGEKFGDLIVDGKKVLHRSGRLEAFHDPHASSRWLMGILCPLVQALMLAMLDAGHDFPPGGPIGFRLVGD